MRTAKTATLLALLLSLGMPAFGQDLDHLIQQLLHDPDPGQREEAAEELEDLGRDASGAEAALIEALRNDPWPDVRQAAASALSDVGEPGGASVEPLRAAMRDSDGHVRLAASNALFRVDDPNKLANVAAFDAFLEEPPANGASGNLYEDVTGFPEAVSDFSAILRIEIHGDGAIVTAREASSPSGWGRFSYERGVLGGPREGSAVSCEKTFKAGDVDFDLIPEIVSKALERAGGEIGAISIDHGVFCKKLGFTVGIQNGSATMIQFKKNGRMGKVF